MNQYSSSICRNLSTPRNSCRYPEILPISYLERAHFPLIPQEIPCIVGLQNNAFNVVLVPVFEVAPDTKVGKGPTELVGFALPGWRKITRNEG